MGVTVITCVLRTARYESTSWLGLFICMCNIKPHDEQALLAGVCESPPHWSEMYECLHYWYVGYQRQLEPKGASMCSEVSWKQLLFLIGLLMYITLSLSTMFCFGFFTWCAVGKNTARLNELVFLNYWEHLLRETSLQVEYQQYLPLCHICSPMCRRHNHKIKTRAGSPLGYQFTEWGCHTSALGV